MIGLAMFAANISTVHLVSLAEAAINWPGIWKLRVDGRFTLICRFSRHFICAPRADTADFLERRFNRSCRDVLSVVSFFRQSSFTWAWRSTAARCCGALIEAGATIIDIDALILFIVVLGLLTGLYTMLGGLLAVVWTEGVQAILLLPELCLSPGGMFKVGGWSALANACHPGSPAFRRYGKQCHLGYRQLPDHGPRRQRSVGAGMVFDPAWLPCAGHMVLVLRPDHCAASACGKR
jgi:SSS family solute:Na+ symporter